METQQDPGSARPTRRDAFRYLGYGAMLLASGPAALAACSSGSGSEPTSGNSGASGAGTPGASSNSTEEATASTASNSTPSPALASIALQTGAREVAFDPIDPIGGSGNGMTINLQWYIYEALFTGGVASPTKTIQQLAAGEPTKVDDTTYKVKIREGATFHDGSPVTADDVAFSFKRLKDLGDKALLAPYIVNFDSWTASGTDEVTVKLKAPMGGLLKQRLAVVQIMSKAAVTGPNSKDVLSYKPIGSGPFKVTSADPSTAAKFSAHEAYNGPYKGRIAAQDLTINIVTDANARAAAVQSGSMNAVTAPPTSSIAALKAAGVTVDTPNGLSTHLFFVNASSKPFNDARVRQAINWAIDRNEVATAAYDGFAAAADALVPSDNADYTAPTTKYVRNVDKAKELLAQAGYANGLTFEFQVPNENASMAAAGQVIQAQLKDAGITATIRSGDTGSLYTRVTGGQYQAMYAGTSPALLGSADAEFVYRWLYYGAFRKQYVYWTDSQGEQVATLLDKAVTSGSPEEYKSVMADVINLTTDFGPIFPIVHPQQVYAYNAKTTPALTPAPVGDLIFAQGV